MADEELVKSVARIESSLRMIEQRLEKLEELDSRVRDIELSVARNGVKLAVLYGALGVAGGAIATSLLRLLQ